MDSLEYIDSYFKGELLPEDSRQMEARIEQDPAFAGEVAFYLSAMQAARDEAAAEKKERFRKLYAASMAGGSSAPVRKLWYYIAAAAVLCAFVLGGYLYVQTSSPQHIAGRYIEQHLSEMSLNMGVADSMQQAKALFNRGALEQSLHYSESLAVARASDYSAREMAGITCLRLKQYDKAISYFRQVESFHLVAGNSYFYHALALIGRNKPGDISEARQLLQQVIDRNDEDKATAAKLLKAL